MLIIRPSRELFKISNILPAKASAPDWSITTDLPLRLEE
jgi:hypothetical protein